jgi:hypothetical protein
LLASGRRYLQYPSGAVEYAHNLKWDSSAVPFPGDLELSPQANALGIDQRRNLAVGTTSNGQDSAMLCCGRVISHHMLFRAWERLSASTISTASVTSEYSVTSPELLQRH